MNVNKARGSIAMGRSFEMRGEVVERKRGVGGGWTGGESKNDMSLS